MCGDTNNKLPSPGVHPPGRPFQEAEYHRDRDYFLNVPFVAASCGIPAAIAASSFEVPPVVPRLCRDASTIAGHTCTSWILSKVEDSTYSDPEPYKLK